MTPASDEQIFRNYPFVAIARVRKIVMHHANVGLIGKNRLWGSGFAILEIEVTRRLGATLSHMEKWDIFPNDKSTIVSINYIASNDERDLKSRHQGKLTIVGDAIASFNSDLARKTLEGKDFIFSIPVDRDGSFHSPETGLLERLHRSCVWTMDELEWAKDLLKNSDGINYPTLTALPL